MAGEDLDLRAQLTVDVSRTVSGMREASRATKSLSDMVRMTQKEMRAKHRALADLARWSARAQRMAQNEMSARYRASAALARSSERAQRRAAQAQMEAARAAAQARQQAMAGTNQLVGTTLGLAAAYGVVSTAASAFQAVSSVVASLTRQQVQYTGELERMQIGLASMVSSVEGMSFSAARQEAEKLYQRIVDISTQSPLGPQEMFQVFSGLNASMRNVGRSYEQILGTTSDAAAAIGAMGIDIDQASRDVALLAAGRAGMDVKTFTELNRRRAFDGKAVSTEQFNAMGDEQRIKLLEGAFKRLGGEAAAAFGDSLIGLSSTLDGLFKEFGRSAFAGMFDSIKGYMKLLNEFLIANRQTFDRILGLFGRVVGSMAGNAFELALDAFKVFAKAVEGFMGAVDRLGPATRYLLQAMPQGLTKGAGTAGMAVAGAGAGAIGGAAIGSAFGPLGTAIGAVAGALAGLVTTFGVLAPLISYVQQNAGALLTIFLDMGKLLGSSVWEAFLAVWDVLAPVIRALGTYIGTTLVTVVLAGTMALVVFAKIIEDVGKAVKAFFRDVGLIDGGLQNTDQALRNFVMGLYDVANSVLYVYAVVRDVAKAIYQAYRNPLKAFEAGQTIGKVFTNGPSNVPRIEPPGDLFERALPNMLARGGFGSTDPNAEKPNRKQPGKTEVKIDKIEIRQNFQEATDPDRIVRIMYRDLEAQAERSIASPFAGALTR